MKLLGSKPGFFSNGVTAADLRDEGTHPEVWEEWMMAVIRGSRGGREAITREDGRLWQGVKLAEVQMSLDRSAERSLKQERCREGEVGNDRRWTTKLDTVPGGLVVRIRRSHRRGPGSIPGQGTLFL